MSGDPYIRNAVVNRVIDGDTIVVTIDLGFAIGCQQTLRFAEINAPELHGVVDTAPGQAAKDYLSSLIPAGTSILVKTDKPNDKYGRYLAWVYTDLTMAQSINQQMVASGHAVPYFGGPR